jgi:TRAP-type C4-dicarboxylate transport system permease small subunit
MRHLLARARAASDFLLSALVIILFAGLTVDVLWGIFTRYTREQGQARWTEELATTLLVWISFLGAALVYGEKGHLGLDYFAGKLDPAARRLADCIAYLLVLIFSCVVLVYGGWLLVDRALDANQLLPALGWKKGYGYAVVPLSGLFFVFYALDGAANALTDRTAAEQPNRVVVE